jgi:drug efflux transport system permease protein
MSLRRSFAVARKEGRHILRDRRSLAMALAVPILMLLLFGLALSLDVDKIPTMVFDKDQTAKSRELIQQFKGSRYFEIVGYTDNYQAIERAIDRNEILLAVVIPPDYSRKTTSGREVSVQLLIDGSNSNTASIALGYAESVVRLYSAELRSEGRNRKAGSSSGSIQSAPPINPELRVWYNSRLESKNYVVPGLIAVILMIIGSVLTSMTIAREWEMGTMEQLLSTPLRPAELVLGKMMAYFVVGIVDLSISIACAVYVFAVPLRGSFLLLVATSCLFLLGTLFWGIYLSAVTKTQLAAYQLAMLSSFLPSFMLSGFVYAIESMPAPIQAFSHLVSARYFVTILKGIFLKGVGLEVLWVDTLFLAAYATVVFFLATRKLKQKIV